MKLFRRQQPGPNPDTEIGRYLTESTHFTHIAPFGGSIQYTRKGQEPSTLAMLQGLVSNEGDGWQWTLEELDRYYEASAAQSFAQGGVPDGPIQPGSVESSPGDEVRARARRPYLDAAALAGQTNGGVAPGLASPTQDPAFMPEPLNSQDIDRLREDLILHASSAFDALKENVARLPDGVLERAGLVLSRRSLVLDRFRQLAASRSMRCAPASTGTIIWDRCCGPKATSSFWTSRVSRRGAGRAQDQAVAAQRRRGHAAFFQLCGLFGPDEVLLAASGRLSSAGAVGAFVGAIGLVGFSAHVL
jgi:hypothetical protein